MTRIRDREKSALQMWLAHQRRAFFRKWRGVIITLAVILLLTFAFDVWEALDLLQTSLHGNASGIAAQLPAWAQMSFSSLQWCSTAHDILQALVFSCAIALQVAFLHNLIPDDEVRLAIGNPTISAYLFKKALQHPIVVFSVTVFPAYMVSIGMQIYWLTAYDVQTKIQYGVESTVQPLKILSQVFFSLYGYSFIAAAVCATISGILVSLMLIQRRVLRFTSFLPAAIYLAYWIVISIPGPQTKYSYGPSIALLAFLPLTIILFIIVVIAARRYYKLNISLKGSKEWT